MRRPKNRLTPSFFPFISVLIAIIGSLIFIILSTTLTALDPVLVLESPMEYVDGVKKQRKNIIIELANGKATVLTGKSENPIIFNADTEWNNLTAFYGRLQKGDPNSWQGTPFLDFANEVAKKRSSEFISFLLRPSGIYEYSIFSDILNMRNAIEFDQEKYPDIEKNWDVDWSLIYVEEDREILIR